jgi:glycosyltransferase involved in cell wall biosynthesis
VPRPTISVALCTYNGAAYVEQQLRSILAQTHAVDEIVVSDDGSSDDTLQVVSRTLEGVAASVVVIENPTPLGVTANFEQAIERTTGDIVVLSDQDDVWHPHRIENALAAFEAGDALVHFTDAQLVDAAGVPLDLTLFESLEVTDATLTAMRDGHAFGTLLKRNLATGATLAFRRDLLADAMPFPREWVHDEWLTILAAARERIAASRELSIDYRQHGENQIGVVRPTLRRKIARVLQPRGDRNRGLEVRTRVLVERLIELGSDELVVEAARAKLEIERFRAALPANRLKRVVPVLRRARTGEYQRYCSQGTMDVVRDLLQPA